MLQLILNYTLMLSVMTYNAWITVAVIVGAGLGFFILAPLSIYRNNIKNTQRYSPKINIISDYSSMDTSLNWLQTSGSDRLQAH